MERLRSVGESLEDIKRTNPPTPAQIERARTDLIDIGGDPENAEILALARQIPVGGKKGVDRVD